MSDAVAEARDALLSLDEVYARLSATEPMTAIPISSTNKVRYTLDPDWALTLEATAPNELVGAYIDVDGMQLQLTKEAALQAGAAFGLPAAYVKKSPAFLTVAGLNYWYGVGIGDQAFNLLAMGEKNAAFAFAKPTVQPFSNIKLLENVISAVREHYQGEIMADFKFDHALAETNIRLVFTDLYTVIDGHEDLWTCGLAIKNSLIGKKQTAIDGYLFNYANLTGATIPLGAGVWSRKSQGQLEDLVLEWAQDSVDEIWPNFDFAYGKLEGLVKAGIGHALGDILGEVWDLHKVPVTQRNQVIEEIIPIEHPTMYDLQQAISRTANDRVLAPNRVDTLLRISGAVLAGVFDPVKAKIWREGNKAPKGAKSPYEIEEI